MVKNRHIVLILISSFIYLLFLAGQAYAINGPHRGAVFPASTDACAVCHRAHTGSALKLLKTGTSRYTFCMFCHNGTGANANDQVGKFEGTVDAIYDGYNSKVDGTPGAGLNGGGFEAAIAYTDRQNRGINPAPDPPTAPTALPYGDGSRHDITGGDDVTKAAWGGGYTGPSQDIANFTCTSCHDPHGTRNEDVGTTERYRILKGTTVSPVNGRNTGVLRSNEIAVWGKHDYTKDAYQTGLSNFCIACHTQYRVDQGIVDPGGNQDQTGEYDAGVGDGAKIRYRHKIIGLTNGNLIGIKGQGTSVWANMVRNPDGVPNSGDEGTRLPVEQPTGYTLDPKQADVITCSTCHQSHGTIATMTASAQVAPASTIGLPSATLLRLSNRGVCQDCHYK